MGFANPFRTLKGTVWKPKRPANPSATLQCPTWGCIISTRGPRYLIIGHLFILLYLHIILVEIVPCFDALYSRIGCITWSYFILYFLKLIYRHHFLLYLTFFYFLFSWLFCFLLTHVVSPIRLRLHVTQEVPLPPYIFNWSWHIEDNVDLDWGES